MDLKMCPLYEKSKELGTPQAAQMICCMDKEYITGIRGASTTGMLALVAASYYPEITLTIAMSPPDFVMEGFYQDGKDGAHERPGDNESSVSWKGEPLPYLPYAYRHPEYWQEIVETFQ